MITRALPQLLPLASLVLVCRPAAGLRGLIPPHTPPDTDTQRYLELT